MNQPLKDHLSSCNQSVPNPKQNQNNYLINRNKNKAENWKPQGLSPHDSFQQETACVGSLVLSKHLELLRTEYKRWVDTQFKGEHSYFQTELMVIWAFMIQHRNYFILRDFKKIEVKTCTLHLELYNPINTKVEFLTSIVHCWGWMIHHI